MAKIIIYLAILPQRHLATTDGNKISINAPSGLAMNGA